ncbi:hypothetical protein V8E54_006330 [Elaphomyces granulatus]
MLIKLVVPSWALVFALLGALYVAWDEAVIMHCHSKELPQEAEQWVIFMSSTYCKGKIGRQTATRPENPSYICILSLGMEECGNCEELPQYWLMNDVKNAMPPEAIDSDSPSSPRAYTHKVGAANLRRDDESNKIGKLRCNQSSVE